MNSIEVSEVCQAHHSLARYLSVDREASSKFPMKRIQNAECNLRPCFREINTICMRIYFLLIIILLQNIEL